MAAATKLFPKPRTPLVISDRPGTVVVKSTAWSPRQCQIVDPSAWLPVEEKLQPARKKDVNSFFGNQQIYHKVGEWFESWRPWQQRILLCGITNRCSTKQLESLASTLEPVFHRDFVVSLQKRYPSAPFRNSECGLAENIMYKTARKNKGRDISISARERNSSAGINHQLKHYLQCTLSGVDVSMGAGQVVPVVMVTEGDTTERSDAAITSPPDGRGDGSFLLAVDSYSSQMAQDIMAEIVRKQPQTFDETTELYASQIYADAWIKIEQELQLIPPLARDPSADQSDNSSQVNQSNQYLTFDDDLEKSREEKEISVEESRVMEDVDGATGPIPRSDTELVSDELSKASSQRPRGILSSVYSRKTRPPYRRCSWSADHIPSSSSTSDVNLPHRHRSQVGFSKVRSVDFFPRKDLVKLGPMQAELRTGRVKKPSQVKDLYVPIQKLYKNYKWFGPHECTGKAFTRPITTKLEGHFKKQIKKVWQWMEDWDGPERLSLLVEIVKLCEQQLVNYLTQCLFQRLHERLDINWLPERLLLLIFSYLSPTDLDACSQVCRRWRYLSNVDELWMVKCHEFGLQHGIPDIIGLIVESSPDNESIDWKLAYKELLDIAAVAMETQALASIKEEYEGPVKVTTVKTSAVAGASIAEKGFAAKLAQLSYELKGISGTPLPDKLPPCIPEVDTPRETETTSELAELLKETVQAKKEREILSSRGTDYTNLSLKTMGRMKILSKRVQDKTQARYLKRVFAGPKKRDTSELIALDVRPQLIQSSDLVYQSGDYNRMERKEDSHLANFSGIVQAVTRVRNFQGHMDAVLCVQFDKRRVLSGSMDRSVRIWDIRSGRSVHKLCGHKGAVTCLVHDNDTLYSASWDMSIMVWDIVHFERIAVLTGHRGSVSCLHLSPEYLLSGSHDRTVRVWDKTTMECLKILEGHHAQVTCLDSDGIVVITGSNDHTIRMTDIKTGQCLQVFTALDSPILKLVLIKNLVIAGSMKGEVYFYHVETGGIEAGIQAHDSAITALDINRNRFFTTSGDMIIKEWDLFSMTCVRQLKGHRSIIHDFKVSDQRIVSCSSDGQLRVWDLYTNSLKMSDTADNILVQLVQHRPAA